MSLEKQLVEHLKVAMKSKDKVALEALRSVKSAILLAKTQVGTLEKLTEQQELKILQKQVKQRKDSAFVFINQKRQDLAELELAQAKIIEQFLPEQLTEKQIEQIVLLTINEIGASGIKDMGKVMGIVSKKLAGKADGKIISTFVKKNLI